VAALVLYQDFHSGFSVHGCQVFCVVDSTIDFTSHADCSVGRRKDIRFRKGLDGAYYAVYL
jgi:hypothetical protein